MKEEDIDGAFKEANDFEDDYEIDETELDGFPDDSGDIGTIEVEELDITIDIDIDSSPEEPMDDILPILDNKHKEKGKHSLKYDSIFKGKKEDPEEEGDDYFIETFTNNNDFEPDTSSTYAFEHESPVEYRRLNELRKTMYDIIINDLHLNIKTSRRKPSKVDFNRYYATIVKKVDLASSSYSEIFIELAYYFSDNIENMFKMLEPEWGGKIAIELATKGNLKGAKSLDDMDFF